MAENNGQVLFELTGESLSSALRLEWEIRKELETVTPQQTGYMNEIRDSWNAFYTNLQKRLEQEAPELLAATGLTAPSVQVNHGKDTWPRAYEHFPQIFSSPEREPRYFMYAPVDYKGDHFTPQDGRLITGREEAKIGTLLFADGWLDNAPVFAKQKSGTTLPPDYNPGANPWLQEDLKNTHTQRVFVAGGESLDAVVDMRRREKEFSAAAGAVSDEIKRIAELEIPKLLEKLPEGENLRASVSYRYGGGLKTVEMLLSVRMEGNVNIMNGGKAVKLESNDAYTLTSDHGNEYKVKPRRDTDAGKKLAALLDAVPKHPTLADYPQLHANFRYKADEIGNMLGLNGVVPFARDVGGRTVLVYNTDKDAPADFTPPGAKAIHAAVYNWLVSDDGDRNMGITPPPMPKEIARALDFAKPKSPAAPKP